MIKDKNKLDNPVWYSLEELHKKFSIASENICFYHPGFCPFGGFISEDHIEKGLTIMPN